MTLALGILLTRNEAILHAPVDADNAVMLNVASGHYFGLNAVATRIWELLTERPMTVGELCARLCAEFDVEEQTCEAAVLAFANALVDNGLVDAAAP